MKIETAYHQLTWVSLSGRQQVIKLIQCYMAAHVKPAEIGRHFCPDSQFSQKLTSSVKEKTYQSKGMVLFVEIMKVDQT